MRNINPLFVFVSGKEKIKHLAKVRVKQTIYLNEEMRRCNNFDEKLYGMIRRNIHLYLHKIIDNDHYCRSKAEPKYVLRNAKGMDRVYFENIIEAIDWEFCEIVEFSTECKELYMEEIYARDKI